MKAMLVDYGAVLVRHAVTVERPEPIPAEWLPLLDDALARLVALGWRNRRLKQVKEKLGTLRILIDQEGESPQFLECATEVAIAARDASEHLRLRSASDSTSASR